MRKRMMPGLVLSATLYFAGPALGQACSTPGQVPIQPVKETRTIPPYPSMSVMTDESGTTLLEVEIGTEGAPTNLKVVGSSGSLRLDEAALEHVKAVWRWKPAMQDCKPVVVTTRVSIKWDLKDRPPSDEPMPPYVVLGKFDYPPGALARREQGEVFITFMITTTAQVGRTQILKSSGFPELDEKALALIKNWHQWRPATMDGKAVNTPMVVGFSWKLDTPAAAGKP